MSGYVVAPRPATPAARPYRLLIAGQSLAQAYQDRSCWPALCAALTQAGAASGFLDRLNVAVGGTVADRRSSYDPVGAPNQHWWDGAAGAPGPLLTNALTAIGASTFAALIFDLGQTDAIYIGAGVNTAANYQAAMTSIITALMAAVPSGVLVLRLVGRRDDGAAPADGVQAVREAQLALAAALPYSVRLVDAYDVALVDGVHPTNEGYAELGRRDAAALLAADSPFAVQSVSIEPGGRAALVTLSAPHQFGAGRVVPGFGARYASGGWLALDAVTVGAATLRVSLPAGLDAGFLPAFSAIVWPLNSLGQHRNLVSIPRDAAGQPLRSAIIPIT